MGLRVKKIEIITEAQKIKLIAKYSQVGLRSPFGFEGKNPFQQYLSQQKNTEFKKFCEAFFSGAKKSAFFLKKEEFLRDINFNDKAEYNDTEENLELIKWVLNIINVAHASIDDY